MFLEKLEVGPLGANCYIIAQSKGKEAVVIDPGADEEEILDIIKKAQLELKYIINTHGHFDHIGADEYLAKTTRATICIHTEDAKLLKDPMGGLLALLEGASTSGFVKEELKDGQSLIFGDLEIKVIHTPGHTPGSICLLVDGKLFTGDLLFKGSVGRTDLAGSSMEKLVDSLRKIIQLPDSVTVYPGHGESTNLGEEKKMNPFLTDL